MKVFISYSRDDKDAVYDLADQLRTEGQHDVWLDKRLVGADEWWKMICTEIAAADCFVYVLTPKSLASIYCQGEFNYARQCNKPILPLKLKPCDIPAEFSAIQFADIEGQSLQTKLFRTDKALSRIQLRIIQGEFPPPEIMPKIPPPPEPALDREQLMEEFERAAIAMERKEWAVAEKLYQAVIKKDPHELGKAAVELLTELKITQERESAYERIVQMAAKPATMATAKALWKFYVERYGLEYDEKGFAEDQRFQAHVSLEIPPPSVDINKFQLLRTFAKYADSVWTMAFSPDGHILASGSYDKTVQLWSFPEGKLLATLSAHTYGVFTVAFSPDGRILASSGYDQTVQLWSIPEGKILMTLKTHTAVRRAVFSPDGRILALGCDDKTVQLWSFPVGKLITTLNAHTDGVTSVAFSPNGRILASGSIDNTVRLWSIPEEKLLATLSARAEEVFSVAFSPDGRILASGCEDNTVRLWSIPDGKLLATLNAHAEGVLSLAFSPDGHILASGSRDSSAQLWSIPDGKLLATLNGHADWVQAVAFSPDGSILALGSDDRTITLWNIP